MQSMELFMESLMPTIMSTRTTVDIIVGMGESSG